MIGKSGYRFSEADHVQDWGAMTIDPEVIVLVASALRFRKGSAMIDEFQKRGIAPRERMFRTCFPPTRPWEPIALALWRQALPRQRARCSAASRRTDIGCSSLKPT